MKTIIITGAGGLIGGEACVFFPIVDKEAVFNLHLINLAFVFPHLLYNLF